MQFNCEKMNITQNKDGTYKLELINCPFKDTNGEEVSGTVTFPRVSKLVWIHLKTRIYYLNQRFIV